MIKVSQFIEQIWLQAISEEARELACSALKLGFTKLYLLHSLDYNEIKNLFREGIAIPAGKRGVSGKLRLAAASVTDLRLALAGKVANGRTARTTALIIEADAEMTGIIRRTLSHSGIRCLVADSLAEARNSTGERYDFVIMRAETADALINVSACPGNQPPLEKGFDILWQTAK